MNNSLQVLEGYASKHILVLGDVMLDSYTVGVVERLSPEAPVPILHVQENFHRPGGAGNAALNLAALSQHVEILGRIGKDASASYLAQGLEDKGISTSGLLVEDDFPTPIKNRFIGNGQQLLRADWESTAAITPSFEKLALAHLSKIIDRLDAIAISDYGKGMCTKSLLQNVIDLALSHQVPVIVDPKGADFTKYRKATLIKPNHKEAMIAAPANDLEACADQLLGITEALYLTITRAEAGISFFNQKREHHHFSALPQEVKDVTGAGDTVLSVLAAGLANRLPIASIIPLANKAASLAIEKVGCVCVSKEELAKRLRKSEIKDEQLEFSSV